MNLIIDIGNTRTKIAIFDNDELMLSIPLDELVVENVQLLIDEYPSLDKAIICFTKPYSNELKTFLQKNFKSFIELDEHTPIPIDNLYGSKETLGKDRLAAAIGANALFPNHNMLIIDAGTAITFDLINSENQYLGGNISPGLAMRFNALHQFTGKLPLVEPSAEVPLIATNTADAIRAGVQNGMLFEIEEYITIFNKKYENLKIIMTGGDSKLFDGKLNYSIFVCPSVTLIGLNRILIHNTDEYL